MKASKTRALWIMIYSIWCTGMICIKTVFKGLLGTIDRAWVDQTMHSWTEDILDAVGAKVKIVNPHNVKINPKVPTIIMSNHESLYDIPLSIKAFPNISLRMLAKKEMGRLPFMGGALRAAEFPMIDRKNRKSAIKSLDYAKKLLKSGIVMWIAPEGTRSNDGVLGSFKKGGFITAIDSKAMIIPIGIRGAFEILPARTYDFHINEQAEIHIGAPIDASLYTLENKDELIEKTRDVMVKLVND